MWDTLISMDVDEVDAYSDALSESRVILKNVKSNNKGFNKRRRRYYDSELPAKRYQRCLETIPEVDSDGEGGLAAGGCAEDIHQNPLMLQINREDIEFLTLGFSTLFSDLGKMSDEPLDDQIAVEIENEASCVDEDPGLNDSAVHNSDMTAEEVQKENMDEIKKLIDYLKNIKSAP